MNGKIIGSRYRVLKYIAEGGFGKTYLAEDMQLPDKDLCVVKQLSPRFEAPKLLAVARRLFETEAAALHSLGHHPQIPQLLAYFEEAEKFYLVQQYIKGQTVDKELAQDRIWSEAQVVTLLNDCLKILQFIHSKGVIHRDLKPANLIRRNTDGKIVIVDFGTVKNILQGHTSMPQLTVAVGTQGYMPTEQARGKPRSTSDLYALGMIGIQALTGVKPIDLEEDKGGEVIWTHLANVKPELATVLSQMTRLNYSDRYQSAQLVLDALAKCSDSSAAPIPLSRSEPKSDPNQARAAEPSLNRGALPGVRSVVMVDSTQLKKKRFRQRLWKTALGVVILSGGLYMTLQTSIFKPTDLPTDARPRQIQTE